jgi:hypothetical protein
VACLLHKPSFLVPRNAKLSSDFSFLLESSGQWEFPSICVWNSTEQVKPKVNKKAEKTPTVEVPVVDSELRSGALDSYLTSIFQSSFDYTSVDSSNRVQTKDAIVHVFSHVCHTYWVEHGEVEASDNRSVLCKRWKLNGREVGWLTEQDMANVGITSGVRKVLAVTK